jgi:hypothetical protein
MLENPNSQRKTRSFKNTNFLGTNQGRSSPREGKEDLDSVTQWERAQVVVVEGGGEVEEAGEVVGMAERGEVTPMTRLPRARIKVRGVITTGNEATTRRWRGRGLRLDKITVHQSVAELLRQI